MRREADGGRRRKKGAGRVGRVATTTAGRDRRRVARDDSRYFDTLLGETIPFFCDRPPLPINLN